MTQEEIRRLINEAAEEGATRALEKIGLHDENAPKDITELRTLLDSWRQTKSTVLKTIVQWMTMAILGALALGAWTQVKGK